MLSDFLNTPEISRGIDLGDLANDHTNKQTCCNSPECIQRTKQAVGKISSSSDNDSTTDVSTAVQCSLRVLRFAGTGKHNTDDRSKDTGNSQHENKFDTFTAGICNCTQSQGGDNCAYIGFKQVGTHTGNVAYVIAYVISDSSRVTRIVFRDTGFNFTNKVSTNVSSFSINTAANTGKQCDRACAQTKTGNNINVTVKNKISYRQAGNAKAYNTQAHYSAAGESDFQSFAHAMTGSFSCTNVSFSSHVHAQITCADGEYSTADKAERSAYG